MENCYRISADAGVDREAGCLYRYIYGKDDIYNLHCHGFYEIFLTISGTVKHMINGIVQKLPEGSLVFIRPDDIHAYIYDTPESNDTVYVNLTFNCETAKLLFDYLSESFPKEELLSCDMPPMVTLNRTHKERLLATISRLNIENWQDKNALKLHLRVILADIFVRFFYKGYDDSSEAFPEWLSALFSEMELPENFTEGSKRMIQLSKKSREHLARSMKKYCGMTTAEYINCLRLNYASNLLLHTNSKVVDICFASGFQNMGYFYKIFKNKYGVSPNEFRKLYCK